MRKAAGRHANSSTRETCEGVTQPRLGPGQARLPSSPGDSVPVTFPCRGGGEVLHATLNFHHDNYAFGKELR